MAGTLPFCIWSPETQTEGLCSEMSPCWERLVRSPDQDLQAGRGTSTSPEAAGVRKGLSMGGAGIGASKK
jgi:hypothetical protein